MMNGFQSEMLKYKRTMTQKLAVLAPLFFVVYALPQKLFMPADFLRPWELITSLVFNWWPVIFLPLGMALFAALVRAQEKKAGNYRALRARNIPAAALWIYKVIAMAAQMLFATIILAVAAVLAGLVTAKGTIPWGAIIPASMITWITSLALIPIQLWAATWNGLFFSMALGFAGMLVGVLAAPKPYWIYVPWSWPTRLMCPVIGVHPNGTLLEASSPLNDSAVIPVGIAVSLVVFVVLTAITALRFSKREVE